MPSRYEGLGLVVWEAMAAGLPLLLADLPVLREAAFGQGTFLPLQPEAWAQAIRKALENPECCAQEGQQNRETVLRHVRPTGSLHQLITLYHSAK
jgi:glycosyltransferase involved in cell wall biosynthesis